MEDYKWSRSFYKQMEGRWKIGMITEAGYKISHKLENISQLEKLTEKIYVKNTLLPYPESCQLLKPELDLWCQGIKLVSGQIEKSQIVDGYIVIALRTIYFSDCDIQNETFTASAIKWASEAFGFSMPSIKVSFDENKSLNGQYIYDFYFCHLLLFGIFLFVV